MHFDIFITLHPLIEYCGALFVLLSIHVYSLFKADMKIFITLHPLIDYVVCYLCC